MKKGTEKLLSLVLALVMVGMLLPVGLTVSANTGTITNITVNPNRPIPNTSGNQIKVVTKPSSTEYLLTDNGNLIFGDRTTMNFAHMGAEIKGLTQIITPTNDSTRASASIKPAMLEFIGSTQEYFNFTTDAPGAVIVLFTANLSTMSGSSYKNNYANWIPLAQNVLPAHPDGASGSWLTLNGSYEPADAPYYFTKWQYEAGVPKYTSRYNYAYKKYFSANNPVSIPVLGRADSQDNMVVLVDWNDIEPDNAKLKELTYTISGEPTATVTGFTPTDEGGTYNVTLPVDTISVTVNANAVHSAAQPVYSAPNGIVDVSSGSGSCIVTMVSGELTNTFTVNFTVSPYSFNAKLSGFTYTPDNGITTDVPGFLATDIGGEYRVTLPEGTRSVHYNGILADNRSTISYNKTQLDQVPGYVTATVTSQGGTQNTFSIQFDLPGYLINDSFDGHGGVDSIIANKKGDWTYAAMNKDTNGTVVEWVDIAQDPKDSSNFVARFNQDRTVAKYSSLKKVVTFNKPMAISGDMLIDKLSTSSAYIDIRKKAGNAADQVASPLRFSADGYIYCGGTGMGEKIPYKWLPNEWIHYTVIMKPDSDPTSMINCPITIIASGGVTDEAGNPTVVTFEKNYNLSNSLYLTDQINIVFNSSLPANKDGWLYQDNLKIYYPAAGEISIPNGVNTSITGPVEVLLSKYEFNPATMVPENLIVTTGLENTPVAVSAVKYNPLRPDKFGLEFYQTLAENTTYTLALDADVTDYAGNPLTGIATFATGTAVPITGISIDAAGSLTQGFGATKKVVFTANTVPYDNVDISDVVWYLDGVQVGTGRSYEFTPNQMDSYVISASVNGTALTAEPKTVTVGKGTRVAPTPVIAKTGNSITITPITDAEYALLPKGSTAEVLYRSSNEFTGLSPDTEYTVYLRLLENEFYFVSVPATLDVTTEAASFGDINADGLFTIVDVIMVAEIAVGYPHYPADQILRANVSSTTDMTVDILDLILILERATGNNIPFPVEIIQ